MKIRGLPRYTQCEVRKCMCVRSGVFFLFLSCLKQLFCVSLWKITHDLPSWHVHTAVQVFKYMNTRRQNKTTWWRSTCLRRFYLLPQWEGREGVWGGMNVNYWHFFTFSPLSSRQHLQVGFYLPRLFKDHKLTPEDKIFHIYFTLKRQQTFFCAWTYNYGVNIYCTVRWGKKNDTIHIKIGLAFTLQAPFTAPRKHVYHCGTKTGIPR